MRLLIIATTAALAFAAPAVAGPFVTVEQAADISRTVNASMVFVPEPAGRDDWQVGQPSGDCEDFVLTKRAALIAAGMPADRIRVLVLLNSKGGHAVLAARFNSMVYVFDRYETGAPIPLRPYLKANHFKIYCEAGDLSLGDKPASARCARP